MKAVSIKAQLISDHTLVVPEDVAQVVPQGKPIQALILLSDSAEDREWEQAIAAEFGMGYADSDAIYDQFSNVK